MTPEQRLEIAEDIARQAGRMILDARTDQDFQQRYKDGQELVTDADVDVDTYIRQRLEDAFPDEHRLSEELAPDRESLEAPSALWIVDPIDGTVNFAHGLRHVAVSIGWASGGHLHLGVVHAPFLDETYTALSGRGARRNGETIQASRSSRLNRALVGTGFPYRHDSRPPLMRRLMAVLTHCQDIRRNGSAALDLCDVACGRLDAYYESVAPWDFAAGLLIAREAGARAGHLYPGPGGIPEDLYGENLLVTSPGLHDDLGELLRRADASELADW
ncbi:inositol monophosphatase family protein [Halomonas sabkhae]|uniref:inositol monophosphatase family protein n=1 Tax=Halomonas sabkhae TaxID=626223 RepID=UPI0025B47171|nr:inositol monophosphatase family protein [Halomonas sabkhae]MDN3526477.1 inositol monophosphatase family protein [Halomonas sabkhae]